jgi:hypothetical protein
MSSSKSLDLDLLNEQKCPVCQEYTASPNNMCENGHNICSSCRLQVSACPTCKGKFINARNVTSNKIAATAIYPCKNREAGCEETFSISDRFKHQSDYLYEGKECPFRKLSGVNCTWTGILSDIAAHVRSEHGTEASDSQVKFTEILQNTSTTERYYKAVFIWDKLFYLIWAFQNSMLYFTVYHFEPQNESAGFTYTFRISGFKREVSVTDTCRSYLQDEGEVLRPGRCLTLHYSTVQKYLDKSKSLSCHIHIRGIYSTGFRSQDMTDYVHVASEISNPSGSSSPHHPLSSSSSHSPHSSKTFSPVVSFLSFHLLCGFFWHLLCYFMIHYLVTYW